jgi:uncharacterized hydrophobic protein (TIGR00341 family)
MRLVQATVPVGAYDAVRDALDDRGIDYYAGDEIGSDEYVAVVHFPIEEADVDSVLEDLYEAGLSDDDHVVILDATADVLQQTDGKTTGTDSYERIAAAELRGKAEDMLPHRNTYVAMILLSTIVATVGLLLDSAAVVVGAMVIAPLFGPAVSASVGTVIDEDELYREGVLYQVLGVAVAVVSATVFAWAMRTAYLLPPGTSIISTPEIVSRLSPDLLSLVVALAAGVAGVLSLATGVAMALVGVMMAAALLPPAATVGIGVAWGEPGVALHSGVLLVVNVLAINLAGLITLWFLGYRPRSWIEVAGLQSELVRRTVTLTIAVVVISLFLGQITYMNVQRAQLEDTLEQEVNKVLGEEKYANVTLDGVKAVKDRSAMFGSIDRVIVTVSRPPGQQYPALRHNIDARVKQETGQNVTVDVRVQLVAPDPGAGISLRPPDDRSPVQEATDGQVAVRSRAVSTPPGPPARDFFPSGG